jgi:hypothetical protein
VFGYFDMTDAPSKLEWVSLRRYDNPQKPAGWYALAVSGPVTRSIPRSRDLLPHGSSWPGR